jgi:hypothetical protein
MATVKGPVNGLKIALKQAGGDVYWSWAIDDNIDPAFKLFHREAGSADEVEIASGVKPCAVHVDFGVDGLQGDALLWRILCLTLNAGTWPLYVQLFQGSPGAYTPISDVIQYDVTVGDGDPPTVSDRIVFA